ncbi:transcriptional regulator [Variovorax paradoxus]|uniref:transcriptional regulator n=1 Tax=Variovorax paradoxus TaxID=34073 RepID=UPI00286A3124|nr:YdaS family helix-turn-helix protein [Variovorax paradoxus]
MDLRTYLSSAGRGAASRLSREIGVLPVLISQWASGARPVPAEHCPAIERATNGAVTCEALNPSEPWRRIADEAWPHLKGRPVLDFVAEAKEAA